MLALSIIATTAATLVPQARANQDASPSIIIQGPFEGYEGDGFYLTFVTNNTGQNMIQVTTLTISLDRGAVQPDIGLSTISPGLWSDETVWVQMPPSESVGLHPFTATFAFQSFNNHTGTWTTSSNSPIVTTGYLLVLPSPTTINAAELATILPVSIAFALAGTLLVLLPTIRKTRNSRPSLYSLPLFSLAATFGSTLHLSIVQTATPCRIGIVAGGFPLPWIPFPYPSVGFHGPLPGCPLPAISPFAILSPLFLLLDTAFYAVIVLVIGLAFRQSRNALFRSWKTLRTRYTQQRASQHVDRIL